MSGSVLFWPMVALVSFAVGLLLWRTALRARGRQVRPSAAYDRDLYRDQLRELERDRARGVIGEAEAERARLEISRRILDADRALKTEAAAQGGGPMLALALGLVAMLAVAFVTYIAVGQPDRADQPLAVRLVAIEADRAARPGQAEAETSAPQLPGAAASGVPEAELQRLRALPDDHADLRDWRALARAEATTRDYVAARIAQERVVALTGPRADADAWVDLARYRVLAAGGYVSPEAEEALRQALSIDSDNGEARFLLGAMYERQGRPDLAFRIWRALLVRSDANDPWVPPIMAQIEIVAERAGERLDLASIAPAGTGGPSQAAMAAAADLSPEDRLAMVEQMVSGLAARLASEGGPPRDWAQLVTSLGVLGQVEDATRILAEARQAFAGDGTAQGILDDAEASLPEIRGE